MEPTIDLLSRGVNFENGQKPLSEVLSLAQSKTKLNHLWGWAAAKGWQEGEVTSMTYVEAEWHNGFWQGENGNYAAPAPSHAWNFALPAGRYRVTTSLPIASGNYSGHGSRFHDQNGTHSYGGTTIQIDHANWKANRFTDRFAMRSANWGNASENGAWSHHTIVQDIHFHGARRSKWYVEDGTQGAGVAIWDSAETSIVRNCYFEEFEKDGLLFNRGTPARSEWCSFFSNNRHGACNMGSGHFTHIGASGDENGGALIAGIPGYGRPGNGIITAIGTKVETGTSGPFRPYKGMPMMHLDGSWAVTIVGATYATTWVNPYAFITINPTVNISSIDWTGVQFFGNSPKAILYDQANGREYGFIGNAWDNVQDSGSWHSKHRLTNKWIGDVPFTTVQKAGRLQHVGDDGATSWATAKVYDITGGSGTTPPPPPPAPTCTFTYTPYGDCINGKKTRTVLTKTPAGCVGDPVDLVVDCTVTPPPPPPSTGVIATLGATSNFSSSFSVPVSWAGCTRFEIKALRASGDMNYRLLVGRIDTDNQGRGIMVTPKGAIIDNRLPADKVLFPDGTLVLNTAKDITITLTTPLSATFRGAAPGSGNAFLGSFTSMVVK